MTHVEQSSNGLGRCSARREGIGTDVDDHCAFQSNKLEAHHDGARQVKSEALTQVNMNWARTPQKSLQSNTAQW
jgi:hypothetical protein